MSDILRELTHKAIECKKRYEQAYKLYENARNDLLNVMLDSNTARYDTKYYKVLRAKSNAVDEDMLEKEYPEIYMAGLECKFNLYKARKVIPARLVNMAVKECGWEDKEHVKLQRKSQRTKGREIERFSPPVESYKQGDYTFAELQNRDNKRNKRHYDRFKHKRFRGHKIRNHNKAIGSSR